MRKSFVMLAALAFAACSKKESYESAGTTDTTADTTHRSGINVGSKVDTLTVPVIETKKDTIVVDKPVGIGKKKVEVKRPTVTKNP
jgi:hypothetical protein